MIFFLSKKKRNSQQHRTRNAWQPTVDGRRRQLFLAEVHRGTPEFCNKQLKRRKKERKHTWGDDEKLLRARWNIWDSSYLSRSVCKSGHQLSPLTPAASDLHWSNYAGWPPTGRLSKGPPKINIHSFRSVICFWHYRPRSASALLFLLSSSSSSYSSSSSLLFIHSLTPSPHQQPGSYGRPLLTRAGSAHLERDISNCRLLLHNPWVMTSQFFFKKVSETSDTSLDMTVLNSRRTNEFLDGEWTGSSENHKVENFFEFPWMIRTDWTKNRARKS